MQCNSWYLLKSLRTSARGALLKIRDVREAWTLRPQEQLSSCNASLLKIYVGHLTRCRAAHSPVPRVAGVGSNRQHSPIAKTFSSGKPLPGGRPASGAAFGDPSSVLQLGFVPVAALWKAKVAGVHGELVVHFCKTQKSRKGLKSARYVF